MSWGDNGSTVRNVQRCSFSDAAAGLVQTGFRRGCFAMRRSEVPFNPRSEHREHPFVRDVGRRLRIGPHHQDPDGGLGRSAVVEHPAQLRHAGEPLPAFALEVEHITLPDRTWPTG